MFPPDRATPTDDIAEAWRRFDPAQPLTPGDPWWVDLTPARDSHDIVEDIAWKIDSASSGPLEERSCLHELVAGHRGCGKSTELLRLAGRLRQGGHFVSYLAVTDYVDEGDVQFGDVLLSVARQVFADLANADVQLNQRLLTSLYEWFAKKVEEKVKVRAEDYKVEVEGKAGIGIPLLGLFSRSLAAIRGKEETRDSVRFVVKDSLEELMNRINEILLSAQNQLLTTHGWRSLVIIVDNLDRIPKPEQQKGIFVEHADQLNRLACHCLYTVPTSLIYSPDGTPVERRFGPPNFVPIVKIAEKDGKPFPAGEKALKEIVHKRASESLFSRGVVTRLCKFSGGHPTDLVRLVRVACSQAREAPVAMAAAKAAEEELTRSFARWLTDADFGRLRRLADDPNRDMEKDDDHKRLLFNAAILPYWNGGAWYDVHPAIRPLPKFISPPEAAQDA